MTTPACAVELLSRGADPNLVGPNGYSPIKTAIGSNFVEQRLDLVNLLLEYGAVLDSKLLFVPAGARVPDAELMMAFLLGKGLDPNVTSEEWGTPLHSAVRCCKPNIVKALLDAGADPTLVSTGRHFRGKTAPDVAQSIRHEGIREAILEPFRAHSAGAAA
ncbi:ankyrin repeat-containing domain protein [Xylariales sp. PMI_506]|nr:ankyrin repeat-containing domain protein [Xylariales sp. PMI_506]